MKSFAVLALSLFSLTSFAGTFTTECGPLDIKTADGLVAVYPTRSSSVDLSRGGDFQLESVSYNTGYNVEVSGLRGRVAEARFVDQYENAGKFHNVYSVKLILTADVYMEQLSFFTTCTEVTNP